ncbi:Hemolysin-type calcium-binding repeat-containing protein [Epibacterium ulvae]|uniref:Hemolysin-type calcium-binding repeat-containing protein n=1 Tax=Epibacterium ulvae TaxID=1156985 RepID=A0A1G5PJI0_9RHOB|nr:calcium-binding protein [Epibacterium ulvae]SCZ49260.1 Hemolysin-type calcium-binding repeat-containing protein [Epibacterium ulvae]
MWPLLLLTVAAGTMAATDFFQSSDEEDLAALEEGDITDLGQLIEELEEEGVEPVALDPYLALGEEASYDLDFSITDGDDLLVLPEADPETHPDFSPSAVVFALEGDDTLIGSELDDVLFGDEGNDSVFGQGGNDQIFGGDGSDYLSGGDGDDDVIETFDDGSQDTLFGGDGNDVIFASGALETGSLRLISGGDGDDSVTLLGGAHIVHLGEGEDAVVVQTNHVEENEAAVVETIVAITDFAPAEDALQIELEVAPDANLPDVSQDFSYTLSEIDTPQGPATLVEPTAHDSASAEILENTLNDAVVILLGVSPQDLEGADISVVLT